MRVKRVASNGRAYEVNAACTVPQQLNKADVLGQLDDIGARLLGPGARRPVLMESSDDKSYTYLKHYIYLCLENKPAFNTLTYVYIHELAHFVNKFSVGHGLSFRKTFFQLLQRAVALGLYEDTDYAATPQTYCGLVINSSAG